MSNLNFSTDAEEDLLSKREKKIITLKIKIHIYLIPEVPTPHDICPLTTILFSCFWKFIDCLKHVCHMHPLLAPLGSPYSLHTGCYSGISLLPGYLQQDPEVVGLQP